MKRTNDGTGKEMTEALKKWRRQVLTHHPRAGRASLQELANCLGIVTAAGPVPSPRFLQVVDLSEFGIHSGEDFGTPNVDTTGGGPA